MAPATYVQWATRRLADFVKIEVAEWESTPPRRVPQLGDDADDDPGWVNVLACQGVEFEADHYHVEADGDAVRITTWHDDPGDFTPDQFCARVWIFGPLRPDPAFGGRYNTDQTEIVYAGAAIIPTVAPAQNRFVLPWANFEPPPAAATRHGIWLPDDVYAAGVTARTPRGWRDYTDGVPASRIRNGKVTG